MSWWMVPSIPEGTDKKYESVKIKGPYTYQNGLKDYRHIMKIIESMFYNIMYYYVFTVWVLLIRNIFQYKKNSLNIRTLKHVCT
jgi:hypothetical protein